MRPAYRYPVDRYLVESSKKFEMVNIVDDDLWEPESALKPEDEIILRKLHSMLQSTAVDLKLLSGELSKYHHKQEEVHVKSRPTPLDYEFNEKVHIEELVNAKFHGLKIVENNPKQVNAKQFVGSLEVVPKTLIKPKINVGTQLNKIPSKKPVSRKLGLTPIKIININGIENYTNITPNEKLNQAKVINTKPSVLYNELSYEYVNPKTNENTCYQLERQDMPSINIRGELKEQKVLQLDIMPENIDEIVNECSKPINVAVIAATHVATPKPQQKTSNTYPSYELRNKMTTNQKPVRKIAKLSTGDSSISSNNISSDTKTNAKSINKYKSNTRTATLSARMTNKTNLFRQESGKKIHFEVDQWKQKLKSVYGQSTKKSKTSAKIQSRGVQSKKLNSPSSMTNAQTNILNNAEYIPYSKLTLGGAKVSDVEREILDLTNKDIPLSPILDKILSSQENTPRKKEKKDDPKVLTTSDENLLEEVLDLERVVSQTISANLVKQSKAPEKSVENVSNKTSNAGDKDSYADDFEDEHSETSLISEKQTSSGSLSEGRPSKCNSYRKSLNSEDLKSDTKSNGKQLNKTYTKVPSLTIKKSVDVFEFVHSIDKHDTATQSNTANKISLKETQTSPKNEGSTIQPIHNELWPSIDPKGEVEKMFQLEKDFIKKVILEEYGDLITRNLEKPSTSEESKNFIAVNVKANQKNTQTSPAHVKCVMTSPTKTKTRTTSPYTSVKVDKVTSPFATVQNEEELKVEVAIGKEDDISVNLSSPRFNLRLPSSSREVLSKRDLSLNKSVDKESKTKCRTYQKGNVSSSSSAEGDYSSSELSSLGEIKLRKLIRKKYRVHTISESSSSTSVSKYSSDGYSGGILPLRSEGEVTNSLAQAIRNIKTSKSEGEMSVRTK